jgi:DNA recombination-dependent growth factor C
MATQAVVLVTSDGATTTYQPQRSPKPFPSAGVFVGFTHPICEAALRDAVLSNVIRSAVPTVQAISGFQAFLQPEQIPMRKRQDFFLEQDGYLALRLVTLSRKIPPTLEKRALAARIQQFVARVGRQPLDREMPVLRSEILAQFLPQAPILEQDQLLLFNPTRSRLFLEGGTVKRAEETIGLLRRLLGTFPVAMLEHELPPATRMTGWLAGNPLPDGLCFGARASLQDDAKSSAALRNHSLESDEVREHLLAGKVATSIGLQWREDVSFQYTASNVFTGIRVGAAIKSSVKVEQMTQADLRVVFGAGARSWFALADALFGCDEIDASASTPAWRALPAPSIATSERARGAAPLALSYDAACETEVLPRLIEGNA